jgi:DNA phosphorothioation-dependent restriction protein DptG
MSALAELKRMPATKSEIASFVASAKNEILSGYENPLILEIQLKALEEVIKNVRKDKEVKDAIVNELNKYPEKSVEFMGVSFTKKSLSKWDYSEDSQWNELTAKIERLKDEMKQHEQLLQNLKEPLYNAETGEEIKPAIRRSEETYSITFK